MDTYAVAIPEHRASVFSATRSPSKRLRVGPSTCATATLTCPAGVPGTLSAAVSMRPSSNFHATRHPIASNTASTNGTPASTPSVLHSSVALRGASPTTYPPQSNDGQSSSSHCCTTRFHDGGSRLAYVGALIVAVHNSWLHPAEARSIQSTEPE